MDDDDDEDWEPAIGMVGEDPVAPDVRKTEVVKIRVSKQELADIKAAAADARRTVADWSRLAILDKL